MALIDQWTTQEQNFQSNTESRTPDFAPLLTKGKNKPRWYGVEKSDSVRCLKLCLMLRSGRMVYLPYSWQPVVEFWPEGFIMIKTRDAQIKISGRGLRHLMEFLYDDRLRWIKEASTTIDDGLENVYIAGIEVDGDIFN